MAVLKVNKENFENEVLRSNLPVLADFNADWCGPCKMLGPLLDQLSAEREDIKIVSINVDDADELAMQYGVSSIPCVVLFKNGAEVARSVGFRPKSEFKRMLEEN